MHFLDHQGKLYRDDPNSGRLQNYPNSLEIHNLRLRPRARTTLSPFLAVQIMVSNTYDVAEHDARCVGVFFRKDTFLENLKRLAGDNQAVLAVLPHVRSWVKPIFRDFAVVTAVHCYLPPGLDNEALGLDTEPLFARLREIKSAFV